MSFAAADEAKERVRQATDLVDLIGSYISLRRQGQAFVGLCPFHQDRRPSLNVNPAKQIWRCFVCNVGGDAFSFVMQRENVGFREALEMLADKAGITIEARPGDSKAGAERKALYDALAWAERQYRECLENQPASGPGRAYFDSRQIAAESRSRFRLGYAPNEWQWLTNRALAQGLAPELLQAAGLIGRKEDGGRWYDRFRGRVMFPIRDVRQRPIAFGGRILPQFADDKTGKYYNSPETVLFQKHREVYGLDLASGPIVEASRTAVLVEGYTDVIMAHQHGVKNVVAVLGTAVTAEHVRQRSVLRRYADTIVLLLDGDAAGQNRAADLVELFVAEDADLRIASLSGGLDPCDFLLERGADALRDLIAGAVDAIEHRIRTVQSGVELDRDTFAASRALESILDALAKAPQSRPGAVTAAARLREQQVLARLAREFHVEESALRARLAELRAAATRTRRKTEQPPPIALGGSPSAGPSKSSGAPSPSSPVHSAPKPSVPGPDAAGIPGASSAAPLVSEFDLAGEADESVAWDGEWRTESHDDAISQPLESQEPWTVAGLDAKDAEFLELLTQYPSLAGAAIGRVELELLAPGPARMIYLAYHQLIQQGQSAELGLVMSSLEDVRIKSLLAELDERGAAKQPRAMNTPEERLEELVIAFQRNRQQNDYRVHSAVFHSADADPTRKAELFLQVLTQKRSNEATQS